MEPEHIIDETATIQGVNIDGIYNRCLEWIKINKIRIKETNKLDYIKIGNVPKYKSHIPLLKNFDIILESIDQSVRVTISTPRTAVSPWMLFLRYQNNKHLEIVESVFRHIGANMNKESLKRLYPKSALSSLMGGSLFFFCIFFVMSLIPIYIVFTMPLPSLVYFIFFFAFGSLGMIILAFPYLTEFLRMLKKKAIIYPNN
jgi:hypothetical protein